MEQWLDFSDFLDKVQELIDLGLYDEAKSLLDRYENSFSDEWELFFLYSRIYAEQNQAEKAIPYLHKALLLDPTNADILVGLFYAYAMTNRMDRAGSYLFEAEKLAPDNEMVLSALVFYYAEMNQLGTAIDYFERIRAKGSTNPETFRNGGIAYDRAGDYDKAAECFRTALDLHPHFDEVRELFSDLYIATEKPEKAVDLYRQALADSPQNIRYLSRLAFCLSQNGEHNRAVEAAEASIRLYPNSQIGHIDLAYAYLNTNDLEKALASAEKALDISPLDAESYRVRAIILSDLGKNNEAEESFQTAISLDTENIEILRDYYNHLRRVGNDAKMEEIVFKVLARNDPSCVEDYWFLADYYKEKRAFLKAVHYLRKAYKIRPGEQNLQSLIADVLIETGHATLSLPFLYRYVARAGWNDFMSQITQHPRLQNRQIQEGLRFLRFYGGGQAEFRRFLFERDFRSGALLSLNLVILAAAFPLLVLLERRPEGGVLEGSLIVITILVTVNIVVRKWGGWFFRRRA